MSRNTVFELEVMQYLEKQQRMQHNRLSEFHEKLSSRIDRLERDIKRFKRLLENESNDHK